VEEEDEKKGVVDNDERREERDEAKPAELEQAKVVSVPMALNRIVPVYPRSARRRGREGEVTVEISVSDSGEVSGVEVIAGSGYKDLDSAAVSAVRTARFAPATEDGVQVHGRLRLTFEFKLR
jgi:protein TonB